MRGLEFRRKVHSGLRTFDGVLKIQDCAPDELPQVSKSLSAAYSELTRSFDTRIHYRQREDVPSKYTEEGLIHSHLHFVYGLSSHCKLADSSDKYFLWAEVLRKHRLRVGREALHWNELSPLDRSYKRQIGYQCKAPKLYRFLETPDILSSVLAVTPHHHFSRGVPM